MNWFKKIYTYISLKQRLSLELGMKVVRITYPCGGYFKHEHKTEAGAKFCKHIQWLVQMPYIHVFWLKHFNKDKYQRIQLAMKGSNRRAMRRRIKRGESAI